ncbi:hypothetical protein PRIPAC_82572 [Pristionchus pacificus]|uniref:G protein-coupled receptor n=1 Tax=Pristionchus pacificus TaxID=54126 RepID=A0A2A6CQV2_PRIPA|nr:hypothetical protein PRIPAC_82572 [Pristionchus pacificus]|eukprot:PDM80411.1 G protein-coupled receptor [Pristionchus pacificus]
MLDEYDRFGQLFTYCVSAIGIAANLLLLIKQPFLSYLLYHSLQYVCRRSDCIHNSGTLSKQTRFVASDSHDVRNILWPMYVCRPSRLLDLSCLKHIRDEKISNQMRGCGTIETQMWMASNNFLCFAFAYRSVRKRDLPSHTVAFFAAFSHVFNFSICLALFCLFLDNDCTVNDIIVARPRYQTILQANYEFAAIQFNSVWSVTDLVFITSSSPVVFVLTFVLRQLTVRTLRGTRSSMSSSTLSLHKMLVSTLNFQLARISVMGISCVIYLLNLSGALDHPLAEVMICATINLLPPAAPMPSMLDEYDRFGQIFTFIVSAFGIAANSLLLIAIKTRSTSSFRVYSTILLNTAVIDLIASTAAALSVSRLVSSHATLTTFVIFSGPCTYAGRIACWICHAVETQMWLSSNNFLCFAFAYRLISVRNRELPNRTVTYFSVLNHVVNCILCTTLFCIFLVNDCTFDDVIAARTHFLTILRSEYQLAAIQYSNTWSVALLLVTTSSSPVVFVVTFVLRELTVRTLLACRSSMSSATLEMHRMLVRTLNFQLALTSVFGVGSAIYLLNLSGILDHSAAEVMVCAVINLLPAAAPVVNFACIQPYRLTTPAFRNYSIILQHTTSVDLIASIAAILSVTRLISSPETATTYLIFTGICTLAGRIPCWLSHVIGNQICYAFVYRFFSVRQRSIERKVNRISHFVGHFQSFSGAVALALFHIFYSNDCSVDDVMAAVIGYHRDQFVQYVLGKSVTISTVTGIRYVQPQFFFFTKMWSIIDTPPSFSLLLRLHSSLLLIVLRNLTLRTLGTMRAMQMSPTTLDVHRMFVRVSGAFFQPLAKQHNCNSTFQTLNFQLALTTIQGIGCAVFIANLLRISEHPLVEVLPCAVRSIKNKILLQKVNQIINLLPAIAPVLNLLCIRPYRMLIFTTSVSAFGVIANAMLLVAIKTRSAISFRIYSTILLNTTAVDLMASVATALSVTRLFSSPATATTYLIFGGPCTYAGRISCWISHVTQNQMWMTSNYFLCFAFAFRLSSVRKKSLRSRTVINASVCIHLASVAVGVSLFSLFVECSVEQLHNVLSPESVTSSPQTLRYHLTSLPSISFTFDSLLPTIQFHTVWSIVAATLIITSSPMVFAATFVLRHLTIYMSPTTLALHRMLIRTLNFQLSLTTLMGLGCGIFMAHLLGIADHPLTEILPCANDERVQIVNLLPALAPILNFSCIRPYRVFLLRLLGFGYISIRSGDVEPSPSIPSAH